MPCTPKMVGCAASCLHYQFVRDYQQERERQEVERENATGGWTTEIEQYPPLIDFKAWLIGSRRPQ